MNDLHVAITGTDVSYEIFYILAGKHWGKCVALFSPNLLIFPHSKISLVCYITYVAMYLLIEVFKVLLFPVHKCNYVSTVAMLYLHTSHQRVHKYIIQGL